MRMRDEFGRIVAIAFGVARTPTVFDPHVAAKLIFNCRTFLLRFVGFGTSFQTL
jgi:hypothetical protein